MKELTKRQNQILKFIKDHWLRSNSPPTLHEIRAHFRFKAIGTVQDHLAALQKKGYIKREKDKARSISILDLKRKLSDITELPVVGSVSAGSPVLAVENIEGYVAIDKSWVKGDKTFALKVQGDSMIGAGICDRDFVIVKQQPIAENGEIVVALIDDEATVKRFYKRNDKITLKAENPNISPLIYHKGDANISIIGKVISIFRRY